MSTFLNNNNNNNNRSNLAAVIPTLMGSTPCAPRARYKSVQPVFGIDPATFSIRGNHLAYAATQVVVIFLIHIEQNVLISVK